MKNKYLISVIIIIVSLFYSGMNELFPWQRGYATISQAQYMRVREGIYFDLSKTTIKHGSLLGIKKNNQKRYAGTGKVDPGYEMLVGLLSYVGFEVNNRLKLGQINYSFVWLAIILASIIFFHLSKSIVVTAMLFLLQIIFFKFSYPYLSRGLVDHHGVVYPITTIGFSLLLLYFSRFNLYKWKGAILFSMLMGVAFGIIALFRNSIGYALLFGLVMHLFFQFKGVNSKKIFKEKSYIFGCILIVVISYKVTYIQSLALFHQQTKITLEIEEEIPEPTVHGVWHNAFIGLGVLPNSWGIKWKDSNGKKHAEKYLPSIEYNSAEYFNVMRTLYFRYLLDQPLEYIKNNILKVFDVIKRTIKSLAIPLVFIWLVMYVRNKYFIKRSVFRRFSNCSYAITMLSLFAVPVMTHSGFSAGFITFFFYYLVSYLFLFEREFDEQLNSINMDKTD